MGSNWCGRDRYRRPGDRDHKQPHGQARLAQDSRRNAEEQLRKDLAALAATADDNPAPFAVADDFARKALATEEGD